MKASEWGHGTVVTQDFETLTDSSFLQLTKPLAQGGGTNKECSNKECVGRTL